MLNFVTFRGLPPLDPLQGTRDSLLVAKCSPTIILPTTLLYLITSCFYLQRKHPNSWEICSGFNVFNLGLQWVHCDPKIARKVKKLLLICSPIYYSPATEFSAHFFTIISFPFQLSCDNYKFSFRIGLILKFVNNLAKCSLFGYFAQKSFVGQLHSKSELPIFFVDFFNGQILEKLVE